MKFLSLTIGLILYNSPVYAYLDPGTGSIIIQGLIAGAAAVMSFVSVYWQKIKSLFGKNEKDTDTTDKD
jgi:hypothetical protein